MKSLRQKTGVVKVICSGASMALYIVGCVALGMLLGALIGSVVFHIFNDSSKALELIRVDQKTDRNE